MTRLRIAPAIACFAAFVCATATPASAQVPAAYVISDSKIGRAHV